MHRLVAHPSAPPKTIDGVTVQLALGDPRELWLEYSVRSAERLSLPEETTPDRADELWKSTCFELFLQPLGSEGYFEFNFSPSFQWAAYAFAGYRSGRRNLPSHDPEIIISSPQADSFFLAVEALPELPPAPLRLGLSAVIEEIDGTKSYWALAHPAANPDFHNPDSFVLELPATGSS